MRDELLETETGKTGLLLISLGTPDAPTYWSVRKYLAEFLSDSRVIEMPRLLWLPLLYGPILTFRSAKAAKAYAKIWDNTLGESPLRTFSRSQAEKMQKKLGAESDVAWAFTYGEPSIADALAELQSRGCQRIVLFALYPQYSATSTGAAYDKAFDALKAMRWQPAVRTVPAYFDKPVFIQQLAGSVTASLAEIDWEPEVLLASYHSIPQSYADAGDPYPAQCHATSAALQASLGLNDSQFKTSFQSRIGPTQWVQPYTDKIVAQLAADGVKKLAVMAPAFSSDCLETLEEINMELRNSFMEAGGTHFHYIPCLNDSVGGMEVLADIATTEMAGWLTL
ncbi:MAG: ferrochelatase [Kordiimonadaceae bacterium]|nr:ferrochelatase [Kordiimonadaceae bacterium]